MAMDGSYLSAARAAQTLGVTRATLYAYVSRGHLRSDAVPGRPKERRYHREDVQRLKEIKAARRDPQSAGARGLHWGGPVLESGITLIDAGHLCFRGHDAVRFAETATVEDAAALLWEVPASERERLFRQPLSVASGELAGIRRLTRDPIGQLQVALAAASSSDAGALDTSARAVRFAGARIMQRLTAVISRQRREDTPIHEVIQATWAPRRPQVAGVIRTALVLCADHELNVSAFTARCAASAGASPYDVVSAALAALKGHRHGGASARVLPLIDRADSLARAKTEIAVRLRDGERLAGFGHPLYPDGDPRAVPLLRMAQESGNPGAWRRVRTTWKAAASLSQQEPNLDFGLAAITRAYELPPYAPLVLFALGRTIGWIAHAIEEYASGQLIRPRARYVGVPPV